MERGKGSKRGSAHISDRCLKIVRHATLEAFSRSFLYSILASRPFNQIIVHFIYKSEWKRNTNLDSNAKRDSAFGNERGTALLPPSLA